MDSWCWIWILLYPASHVKWFKSLWKVLAISYGSNLNQPRHKIEWLDILMVFITKLIAMLSNITRKPAKLDIINCLLQFNLNQGVIMVSILVLASISISTRKSGNKKKLSMGILSSTDSMRIMDTCVLEVVRLFRWVLIFCLFSLVSIHICAGHFKV